jgi:putative zinc ribbon protein
MKTIKSGKRRRAEIVAARKRRQARRSAVGVLQAISLRPPRTAPVERAALRPHNSYGEPGFVTRGYYQDLAFRCVDCGAEGVWTAERQKWWYEVVKGEVFTTARRCAACRDHERARKIIARQVHQAGLLRKTTDRC